MSHVSIVGGTSGVGRITLESEEHVAVATYHDDDTITCEVRAHSASVRRLRARRLLMPQTLRLLLFLFGSVTRLQAVRLLVSIAVLAAYPFVVPYVSKMPEAHGYLSIVSMVVGILVGCGVFSGGSIFKIRRWHAAEHMAVGSYADGEGSAELERIAAADRVQAYCGGRLAFPLLVLTLLVALVIAPALHLSLGARLCISILAPLEGTLQIDSLIGWHRIPIFRQASELLQRYVTTAPPEEKHLRTAKAALDALIAASETVSC